MFIIVKDPPASSVAFLEALSSVIENIYDDLSSAQMDAVNLATTNPGHIYVVFSLVAVGNAIVSVQPTPPATWTDMK